MNAGNGSLRAFTASLSATDRPEAIIGEFARFIRGFRLPAVFFADLTGSRDAGPARPTDSNWPPDWRLEYERMGGIARDALLQQARSRIAPYRWTDGPAPGSDEIPAPASTGLVNAARRFAEQNDLNWRDGLYFPVHWPPDRAGVVACWGDPPEWGDDDEMRLHMAACRAFWRWCAVQSATPEQDSGDPGSRSETAKLGRREIEVLSLIAAGYTDAAAAGALGLTERTILHYVTRARTRLACRTRAQVVAVSVRLGLI